MTHENMIKSEFFVFLEIWQDLQNLDETYEDSLALAIAKSLSESLKSVSKNPSCILLNPDPPAAKPDSDSEVKTKWTVFSFWNHLTIAF